MSGKRGGHLNRVLAEKPLQRTNKLRERALHLEYTLSTTYIRVSIITLRRIADLERHNKVIYET